jgi:hypothetical protein
MNTCLHRSKIVIGVALVVPILLPNDASAGSGPTGFI